MAAAIFTKMAELGLMGARAIRPTKLKRGMRIAGEKVIKKRLDPKKYPKMSTYEDTGLKLMSSLGEKTQKGYSYAYKKTLGTSGRRKFTTGVVTGGIGFDIFDDD
jgi:hypothetical protein